MLGLCIKHEEDVAELFIFHNIKMAIFSIPVFKDSRSIVKASRMSPSKL